MKNGCTSAPLKSKQSRSSNINPEPIRRRLNKTQAEFAELLGVTPDKLQRWEQGRRPPRPIQTILKLIELQPSYILPILEKQRQTRTREPKP
ncbi:helix-turn-helix domain-containing protein [Bergeriella denitrificans]|uniref:helix-turn-helix domain-containing protein n=1 Tax=Bergeriella denitrificans TaxID=494 RepID=UPI0009EF4522